MSITFQFPEIMINLITSDVYDSEAKCPEYKLVAVNIRKSKGQQRMMAEAQGASAGVETVPYDKLKD